MPRIVLIHALLESMAPMSRAFKALWPDAEALNLLDETLYADAASDGRLSDDLTDRIRTLLHHSMRSGADGVLFTGSAFGPAVEVARQDLPVPVLRADEGLAFALAEAGRPVCLLATAARALPVLDTAVRAAMTGDHDSVAPTALHVEGAETARRQGDLARHDRLIAAAATAADPGSVIGLGQMSMGAARDLLPDHIRNRTVISSEASVLLMRRKLGLAA